MTVTPQPASESATTALYRAALGPVNVDRYLPVFARFDEEGRAGPSWNWAAALLTLNWLVFRQLWGVALVYVAAVEGLALLVLGLGREWLATPSLAEWGFLGAISGVELPDSRCVWQRLAARRHAPAHDARRARRQDGARGLRRPGTTRELPQASVGPGGHQRGAGSRCGGGLLGLVPVGERTAGAAHGGAACGGGARGAHARAARAAGA